MKEEYREICRHSSQAVPIYSQAWWLDAVSDGYEWGVLIARDQQQRPTATLPYLLRRKAGQLFMIMPQLTQSLGVTYHYPSDLHPRNRAEFEKRECAKILAQIDAMRPGYFGQSFSPEFTNWLPFYWAGYSQTTRYTYCIEDLQTRRRPISASYSPAKQRQIRKAQRQCVTIGEDRMKAEDFAEYHAKVLRDRGQRDTIPPRLLKTLIDQARSRGQGCILTAEDCKGETLSALFMVWDKRRAYYLVPANDRAASRYGAADCLVDAAVQKAAALGCSIFDFEGSMDPGIGNSYSQFGTTPVPYMAISKAGTWLCRIWAFAKSR